MIYPHNQECENTKKITPLCKQLYLHSEFKSKNLYQHSNKAYRDLRHKKSANDNQFCHGN